MSPGIEHFETDPHREEPRATARPDGDARMLLAWFIAVTALVVVLILLM